MQLILVKENHICPETTPLILANLHLLQCQNNHKNTNARHEVGSKRAIKNFLDNILQNPDRRVQLYYIKCSCKSVLCPCFLPIMFSNILPQPITMISYVNRDLREHVENNQKCLSRVLIDNKHCIHDNVETK